MDLGLGLRVGAVEEAEKGVRMLEEREIMRAISSGKVEGAKPSGEPEVTAAQ